VAQEEKEPVGFGQLLPREETWGATVRLGKGEAQAL
jgi:hypothetical protein